MKTIAALFATLALLSACSPEPGPPREGSGMTGDIAIAGFAFDPSSVDVERGQTVTWINQDDIAHTVTSGRPKRQGVPGVSDNRDAQPDGAFDSGTMELNDDYIHTFDKHGTFTYYCAIHAGMKARVVVH